MTGTLIYKMLLVTHFATSPQCEDWTERMYIEKANCFEFRTPSGLKTYSQIYLMDFKDLSQCEAWSNEIYGDAKHCMKSYTYPDEFMEAPLPRPKIIEETNYETQKR